jgi:hypothetical protein
VEQADGTVLGSTPLQRPFARGEGSKPLVLRLAGYKDKTLAVGLADDSSALVELEPLPQAPSNVGKSPSGDREARKKTAGRVRKPIRDEEEEWRVH